MSREKSEALGKYNILKSKMQVMVDEKVKELIENMKNNDKNLNKGICLQTRVNMNSNKDSIIGIKWLLKVRKGTKRRVRNNGKRK